MKTIRFCGILDTLSYAARTIYRVVRSLASEAAADHIREGCHEETDPAALQIRIVTVRAETPFKPARTVFEQSIRLFCLLEWRT